MFFNFQGDFETDKCLDQDKLTPWVKAYQNPNDLRDSILNFSEFYESLGESDLQPELIEQGM